MSGRGLCLKIARAALLPILFTPAAEATFHTWQINEIYSNADGTVQFIELRESSGFNSQHLLSGHTFDTNANSFPYTSNLPSSATANKFFLMATSGFGELPGGVTPDYTIPANFFATAGDTLDFAAVDVVSYTSGQLPTDGVQSIDRNLVPQTNSPTNFAGNTGSVGSSDPESVWVDFAYTGTETGAEAQPFNMLTEAVEAVAIAGTINVNAGSTSEILTISTPVTLMALGGTVRIGTTAAKAAALRTAARASVGDDSPPQAIPIELLGILKGDLSAAPDSSWGTTTTATTAVYESAFPLANTEGTRIAGTRQTLAVRLSAGVALIPESIWTTILPDDLEAEAVWQSANGDGLDDVWVLVRPLNGWPAGEQVVIAVGGVTNEGHAVEAPVQVFQIAEDAESQASTPTAQPAGGGEFEIAPDAVYPRPVTLEIPYASGESIEYFHQDSNAWYPADAVAGFLAGAPRLVRHDGVQYLEIQVLHGGRVR